MASSGDKVEDGAGSTPRVGGVDTAKHDLVVGIDFGTTRSGFAFAFVDRKDEIEAVEPGGTGANLKTLTNVLFSADGAFRSFGFRARRDYCDECDDAEDGTAVDLLFEKFKMLLEPRGDSHYAAEGTSSTAASEESKDGGKASGERKGSTREGPMVTLKPTPIECATDDGPTSVGGGGGGTGGGAPGTPSAAVTPTGTAGGATTGATGTTDGAAEGASGEAKEDPAAAAKKVSTPDELAPLDSSMAKILATAKNGKTMRLMDIISESLAYIKQEAIKRINAHTHTKLPASRILWVLTVPAIWDDFGKRFMRTAACRAGLVDRVDSDRLVLALEPEGACLACCTDLPAAMASLTPGTKFMVLDAGGGTVDITVHQLKRMTPIRLGEVIAPSGGPWGSTAVDREFEALLKDIMGEEPFAEFTRTGNAVDMLDEWENLKLGFTGNEEGFKKINLGPILDYFPEGLDLRSAIAKYNEAHGTDIRVRGATSCRLPVAVLKSLFKPVVDSIISHVGNLLKQPRNADLGYIMMVGGFAESELLQNAIRAEFETADRRVVVPLKPGVAVMKGAVIFGLDGQAVTARRAKYTYGTAVSVPFNADKHPDERAEYGDGKKFCFGVFDAAIKADDLVNLNQEIKFSRLPLKRKQTHMTIKFYRSAARDPDYVDDPTVSELGQLKISVGGVGKDVRDRAVTITLCFGRTEFYVTAEDMNTHEQQACTMTFKSL